MNRTRALALTLVMTATSLVSAEAPESKQPSTPGTKAADVGVEQTLMKLERDTLAALLKKDSAAFGRIFSDDAVLITPDGSPQTKAQLLADLKSGDLAIATSDISDMKVRAFGDTAVVTYVTIDKGTYKGQDISGRYRWTDVFVRRAGSWQIVAGQGTRIESPK